MWKWSNQNTVAFYKCEFSFRMLNIGWKYGFTSTLSVKSGNSNSNAVLSHVSVRHVNGGINMLWKKDFWITFKFCKCFPQLYYYFHLDPNFSKKFVVSGSNLMSKAGIAKKNSFDKIFTSRFTVVTFDQTCWWFKSCFSFANVYLKINLVLLVPRS